MPTETLDITTTNEGPSPVEQFAEHHLFELPLKETKAVTGIRSWDTVETSKKEEFFAYNTYTANATKIIEQMATKDIERAAEVRANLTETGLKDIHAEIYTRGNLQNEQQLAEKNVYVLLHGWTASHEIYSDVKQENHFTIVEEILARDPNALIIAMDGNGFGETNFTRHVLDHDLERYCTPEAYAHQVDFFVEDVLGFSRSEKSQISISGHSMGAAAGLILGAKENYQNVVANAPAFFPMHKNLLEIAQFFSEYEDSDAFRKFLRSIGVHTQGDLTYAAISSAARAGKVVNRMTRDIARKPVSAITSAIFKYIGPPLIGKKTSNTPEHDTSIRESLAVIHKKQARREPALVQLALSNLRSSVDLSEFSLEELANLNDCFVITAEDDLLVTPSDQANLIRAITAYQVIKAFKTPVEELSVEQREEIVAEVEAVMRAQSLEGNRYVIPGGHYASVFSQLSMDALVQGAIHLREKRNQTSKETVTQIGG